MGTSNLKPSYTELVGNLEIHYLEMASNTGGQSRGTDTLMHGTC